MKIMIIFFLTTKNKTKSKQNQKKNQKKSKNNKPKKGGPQAKKAWTNYNINSFLSMLFLNPTQKILCAPISQTCKKEEKRKEKKRKKEKKKKRKEKKKKRKKKEKKKNSIKKKLQSTKKGIPQKLTSLSEKQLLHSFVLSSLY